MTEPTEDQVLQRAKELCRDDGEIWSKDDLQTVSAAQKEAAIILDDAGRAEYLNRAAEQLRREP